MEDKKKALSSKRLATLVWVIGLVIVWEIIAMVVSHTKRTPENVLPHLWQIAV